MIKAGIIKENEIIEIENDKLIPYLYNLLNNSSENKKSFEVYKKSQFFWMDSNIIDYYVRVLGYIIIHNETIYFQSGKEDLFDKVAYVQSGFRINKLPKSINKDGKFINYLNPAQEEIERIGFEHSISPENNLSFWYPKTTNIGFRTPNTIITTFTEDEIRLIKTTKWHNLRLDWAFRVINLILIHVISIILMNYIKN